MAQAPGPATGDATAICFELDRLEPTGAGRLELSGRWFGVRGRRFMRPTVTFCAGGVRFRLLADIEHKPWAPEEGEPWLAVFPWQDPGGKLSELELSVAPDITLELPAPGTAASEPLRPSSREAVVLAKRDPPDLDALGRRLADEQHKNEHLREQLRRRESEAVQAVAAIGRRDAALSALALAEDDRDRSAAALRQARSEHSAAARALESERDAALAALKRAQTEAVNARSETRLAKAERDRIAAERDRTRAECDRIAQERDRIVRERDGIVQEHQRIAREREAAAAERERVAAAAEGERERVAQAQPVRRGSLRPGASRGASWALRVIALIVLAAVVVALAAIVRVI